MANTTETKVLTGVARLSYAHLFHPHNASGGDEKYSVSLLIPKTDVKTIQAIKRAIEAATEEGRANKFGGKVPSNLATVFHDGDVDRADDPNYANHYYVNARSDKKPQIAKPVGKSSDGKTKFQEITDETEVYSGCYARASINFYAYNFNGKKGIACGLNSVVKVQDGEPLAGRADVNQDFADEDFDTDFDTDFDDDYMN